jgi:predicted dehydrogenase
MSDNVRVLIVGAGPIAREYIDVCLSRGSQPLAVTRGQQGASGLRDEYPSVHVVAGGLTSYLAENTPPKAAILATPIPTLAPLCRALIRSETERILAEKPLVLTSSAAAKLRSLADQRSTEVAIAYNRRNYASVRAAAERIQESGGVTSFSFTFTEATWRIDPDDYADSVLRRWGIANSSHVIDTAFHLCGSPASLQSSQQGDAVPWHPAGSIFSGRGQTDDGTPFSYHADWGAPGSWGIEVNTPERKLVFSPMERLQAQERGSFEVVELDATDDLDEEFKPGFYRQTDQFLTAETEALMGIEELGDELRTLENIFGYE